MIFQHKFVDLVRNFTETVGRANFMLGDPVDGYTGFADACQVGDLFYYSAIGIDNPEEREVGRGTMLAGGRIRRSPISGAKTNFTSGAKSVALIAPAELGSDFDSGQHQLPAPAHKTKPGLPKGYKPYDGKGCPVDPDQFVDLIIRTSEGLAHSGVVRANYHDWEQGNKHGHGHIVGYRKAEPGEMPAPSLLTERWPEN